MQLGPRAEHNAIQSWKSPRQIYYTNAHIFGVGDQGLIADLPGSAHKADVTGGRTQEQGGSETLTDQAGSSSSGGSSNSDTRSKQSFLKTLWDFSRPHTMIGTAMAIPSIGLFAAPAG